MIFLAAFFDEFSPGFGLSPGEALVVWWTVIVALLAVLGYTIGRWVYRVFAARLKITRLFAKLAEANALDPEEKDLLLQIAKTAEMDNPSILFLRPSLVRQQYAALPALPDPANPANPANPAARQKTFDRLCSKLWG